MRPDDAISLLAATGPLPFILFEQLVGPDHIADIDHIDGVGSGTSLHSLVSLTSGVEMNVVVTLSDRVRHVRALARAVQSHGLGPAPPHVTARIGALLCEAESYDPAVFVRATRAALMTGDVELALELTAFGLRSDATNLALVHLRSMAFEAAGRHGAATSADVHHIGLDDAAWLGRWASNLWQSTGRTVDPAHVLPDDPRNEMRANHAWIEAFQGDVDVVASTVAGILDDPRSSTQAVVWACVAGAFPAALDGRPSIAVRLVDHARSLVDGEPEQLTPFADLQVALCDVLCRVFTGDLEHAQRSAEDRREGAPTDSMLRSIWSLMAGFVARKRDAFAEAVDLFDDGLQAVDGDPFGLGRWAHSERNLSAAMAGRAHDVEVGLPGADAHGVFRACLFRNRAWWCAAVGELDDAVDAIDSSIDTARTLGQNVYLLDGLVDLARFGEPKRAESMLTELSEVSAPHMATGITAVTALASNSAIDLVEAAIAARRAGSPMCSAELLVLARGRARAHGDVALESRLDLIIGDDVWPTPIFHEADLAARRVTARERVIAQHASTGLTDNEIGRLLDISTRTVNNHLGHVYAKCALSGRLELSGWLARIGI